MPKFNNKEVMQSYILTTAKYDFSVYEKRIIYKLVEIAQSETNGLEFPKDCRKIDHDLFGYVNIEMPISVLLANETDKNHKLAKDALTKLSQKYLIYEDEKIWEKINIVLSPKIEKFNNKVKFTLEPKIWDCMLNFSKGYRKYELKTAMSFESIYSMRFYELLSGQKRPLTYGVEDLKAMFQLEGKYSRINDFVRFVLEPARKELDGKSPYSFTYKPNEGRKITHFTFFPVYHPEHRDEDLERKELQKRIPLGWQITPQLRDMLINDFDFDDKGIKSNMELFKALEKKLGTTALNALDKIKANISRTRPANKQGYLINSLKKELQL